MKITDIKATTVSVPLEAPLRHSNGTHWGRFVRTIVEVETDEGIVGFGEMGGGGESAELAIRGLKTYLVGHDPMEFESMKFKICNPTASLYNNRTQLFAAIEFACLDIVGKKLGIPVYKLLGGKLRDEVTFASYLFFRYPNEVTGKGEIRTAEQLIEHTRELKQLHGFKTHKLKGGVFDPAYELECYLALAEEFPEDRYRFDPNSVYSVEHSVEFAKAIRHINNDYFEDPTWGLNGMRRVREKIDIPLSTNSVIVNFEQLSQNILNPAVDVILLDTTFWGGVRACVKAATVCETFQYSVAVHSSGELGIQLATMLHLGSVIANMPFAIDAHYHQLEDDILVGGKMKYINGAMKVPEEPGLGIEVDRDKVSFYAEEYKRLGGYAYDRDPKRPEWYPLLPNDRWAKP